MNHERELCVTRRRRKLHCMVRYPTECSPVWKHFYFKLPKPLEQTTLYSCKAMQSVKERPLSLKQLEIRS